MIDLGTLHGVRIMQKSGLRRACCANEEMEEVRFTVEDATAISKALLNLIRELQVRRFNITKVEIE